MLASQSLKPLSESASQLMKASHSKFKKAERAKINTRQKEDSRKSFEKVTSDWLITDRLKSTKSLCQSAATKLNNYLITLRNWPKIDQKYWLFGLSQIQKFVQDYTDGIGKLSSVISGSESYDLTKQPEFHKYDDAAKAAILVFVNALTVRKEALYKVNDYVLVKYRLMRFIPIFIELCKEHLIKDDKSETNAENLIAQIEFMERKRQKKIKLVSEDSIEEEDSDKEIKTDEEPIETDFIPEFAPAQEIKLIDPREQLETGLKTILKEFLQNINCKDLFVFSQSAAYLCRLILKNHYFINEEYNYPKLELYEKRALKAAFHDASHHLFLSSCGFEMFAKTLQDGRLSSLSLIVRMLILDWHGVSEQARRAHHIAKFQKTSESHHLLEIKKTEKGASPEYLQALDNGLIWSRYPVSNAEARQPRLPLGLHWMKFCHKLQNKILHKKPGVMTDQDILDLHQLIEFICNCQFNAWRDANQLLYKGSDFEPFYADALDAVKAQMKAWALRLNDKKYAELGAENILQEQQEILGLLTALKRQSKGTPKGVRVESGNIKRHLTELHTAVWLRHKNDNKRFQALFDRNLLNLQWVLESSYRILASKQNIKVIFDHDLTVLQNFLKFAGVKISVEEEGDAEHFNLREMMYYPHYVKYTRGNLSKKVVDLLAGTKTAKEICLHGEKDVSVSPAEPDQTFLRGLQVLSKHISGMSHGKDKTSDDDAF